MDMRRASGQFSTVKSISASVNSLSSRLPDDGIAAVVVVPLNDDEPFDNLLFEPINKSNNVKSIL